VLHLLTSSTPVLKALKKIKALALKPRRQAFSGMLQRMPSTSILFEF
jgi:hypothetical protein